MASFTFTDFLVFAGSTNVSEEKYSTIAKGVLGFINRQYGIYPEVETLVQPIFTTSGQVSITPKAFPVNSVYRIWYDDDLMDDTDYTYYGEDILLTASVIEPRKPLLLELEVGFSADTFPDDLVLAIYRHIISVYHAIDKHTDNLSKSINSDGNTSYYNNEVVPPACKQTYEFYAGHTLLRT